jgi:hypothetical protein
VSTFTKTPWESLQNRHAATLKPEVLAMLTNLVQLLSQQEISLSSLLNQGLRMPDNFDGKILSYTSNLTADTTDTIAHGLRKTPSYFMVLSIDKPGILYKSAPFDALSVYLKCSIEAAAVSIFVF